MKFVPVIVTPAPTKPLAGEKLLMVGVALAIETVKLLADVAVPPAVVTEIVPLVAPAGTEVVIWVALVMVKVAAVPLNLTDVAPVNVVPVIVTGVPTVPLAGAKLAIAGASGCVAGAGADEDIVAPPHPAHARAIVRTAASRASERGKVRAVSAAVIMTFWLLS